MKKEALLTVQSNGERKAISPFMFGHFVEDMRDHMEGMMAHSLLDMDFEKEDLHYRGVSSPWYPVTDGRKTTYQLEPAYAGHTGHSQKIKIYSSDRCYAGIAQKAAVKSGMSYEITAWIRSSVEIAFVDISLHSYRDGSCMDSQRIALKKNDWSCYHTKLQWDSPDSIAELRIGTNTIEQQWIDVSQNGMLWIDHLSMIPTDHVNLVKKEVMEMAERLHCPMLRWGGNQMSAYHWRDYVGPYETRPAFRSEVWEHWMNKYFGTDEFVAMCRHLRAEPLICLNLGSGTVEEALDWIEYCNGSVLTPMGKLRQQHGHELPYQIKYWELGNELWGVAQVGHCSEDEYAERCLTFAKAIKEKYPDIMLIGCGHMSMEWNKALLEKVAGYIDYIALHYYHGRDIPAVVLTPGSHDDYDYMVTTAEAYDNLIQSTRSVLASDERYSHIQIAFTEYNVVFANEPAFVRLPDQHTLQSALSIAGTLHAFLRNADIIFTSQFSDLVNGWPGGCIRVTDCDKPPVRGMPANANLEGAIVYGTPAFHVLEMYALMKPKWTLTTAIDVETYTLPEALRKFPLPRTKTEFNAFHMTEEFPLVDALACLNEQHHYVIFAINRGREPITLKVDLGTTPAKTEVCFVGGLHHRAINSKQEPEQLISRMGKAEIISSGFRLELEPNSVYAIKAE